MKPLALLSDFGLREHYVATMKGVALQIAEDLRIFDITHQIPPFDIWDAAITLNSAVDYWPVGTVFVAVVDPGVGTDRRSCVIKTKAGQLIVGPDNGLFTFLSSGGVIERIRKVNALVHRRPNSQLHHTFDGRDLYIYLGARLAAGLIAFEDVGTLIAPHELISLEHQREERVGDTVLGTVMKIEEPFGNLVTNISAATIDDDRMKYGHDLRVVILKNGNLCFEKKLLLVKTFADLVQGRPMAYIDSSRKLGLALNRGHFATTYDIGSGPEWTINIGLH